MTSTTVVEHGRPPGGSWFARRWPWVVLAVAMAFAAVLYLRVGRELTWFFDEWGWILDRRTGGLDDYLVQHNGHLNVVPVIVYKLYWSVFGLENYGVFRGLLLLLHFGVCALLLMFLRRRLSDPLALVLTVAVLLLGSAWQDLLWPFQIQYLGSMAGGLGALVLLDRGDRRGDVGASVCLGVAVACSGLGLPFVGVVALRLVLRRADWTRIWVPVAPVALYGVWYLGYSTSQAKGSNLPLLPSYVEQAASASGGALFGVSADTGRWAVLVIAVLVVVLSVRRRRVSPELASLVVLPVAFWAVTGLSRAHLGEPGASRYLYPGAVFLVLVLGEAVHDREWPSASRWRPVVWALATLLLVVSVLGNVADLRDGGAGLRSVSAHVRAELAAVELLGSGLDPDYRPDAARAPQITVGPYLAAIDDLGSPAASLDEVRAAPQDVRWSFDRVLLEATGGGLDPVSSGPVVVCEAVDVGGSGLAIRDGAFAGALTVTGGSAPVVVQAQLLATDWTGGVLGEVAPGDTLAVDVPDLDAGEWTIRTYSTAPFTVCSPPGA